MSDLVANYLGLARDVEASDKILDKDLDRLPIQNKVAHGSLGQYDDIEREHRKFWRAICNALEMA